MHNIKTNFDKILIVVKNILGDDVNELGNFKRRGVVPRFSDVEIISLSITAECLSIDSENLLFSKLMAEYLNDFKNLISRRQYNDRRKSLFTAKEKVRQRMADELNEIAAAFSVDSMPVEICKLSRSSRNKMKTDSIETAPDKGYCASQQKYFFGYKVHSVCSVSGVIQSFDLSKASVHDIHYLKDVSHIFSNCLIVGDKGYISQEQQISLFESARIQLEVPSRSNQKEQKRVLPVLKRIRKRVETVYSQLCDQFMIQRNYAKSFKGFKCRVLAKISGMTILQYLNKFFYNQPISRIKHALAN